MNIHVRVFPTVFARDSRQSSTRMPKRRASAYDALDVAVALLKRRDGIDKTLKLVRYAAIFAASEARGASNDASPFVSRATALEKSLGDARRALRLGKFLGNVQEVRDAIRAHHSHRGSALARSTSAVAMCALLEGVYYFLEQGVWLNKAGVALRDKSTLTRMVRWSARAELLSYAFSVTISVDDWRDARARRIEAERILDDGETASARGGDVARARRDGRKAMLAIAQDVMDAVLSFEDAIDVPGVELGPERFVNALALLAAALDFHGKLNAAIESLDS